MDRDGDGPSTSAPPTEAGPVAAKAPIKTKKIEIKLPFANDGSFLETMKKLEVGILSLPPLSLSLPPSLTSL